MPELKVEIGGQLHPLTNCVWITWAPCGCPCGALTAAFGDEAFATEEQAWREQYPLKRERDRYQRQGYRLELMGWDRYRSDVDLAAKCPHAKAKTTQQTLDAVETERAYAAATARDFAATDAAGYIDRTGLEGS